MQQAGTFAKGYLLKHNRDCRKSNILGAKYKRRYVEVTADTFVYAPSQQDVLTGHIQVFAITDMVWVKPEADTKFQVKFPERTLKLKVAAGGQEERDKWVGALQAAKKHHEAAEEARRSGAGRLEQLQKALLQPPTDNIIHSSTANATQPSASGSMVLSSAGTSMDGTSQSGDGGAISSSLAGLALTASTFGASEPNSSVAGGRPPSPRTLLAYQSTMPLLLQNTHSQSLSASVSTPRGKQERFFIGNPAPCNSDNEDDDGGGGDYGVDHETDSEVEDISEQEGSGGAARERQQGQGSRTPDSSLVQGQISSPAQGQHVAAPALQLPADGPHAADGSGHATPSSARRASLARRITPGVLLASPRPTTPAGAAAMAQQHHSLPFSPRPTATSSPRVLPPPAASTANPAHCALSAPLTPPDADDVLLLDEPDYPQPLSAQHGAAGGGRMAATAVAAVGGSISTPAAEVFNSRLYSTTRPTSSSSSSSSSHAPPHHMPAAQASTNVAGIGCAANISSSPGDEDEVLRLDEDEDLAGPCSYPNTSSSNSNHLQCQQQQQPCGVALGQQAAVDSGDGWQPSPVNRPGVLQVGSRPGSAVSGYRPGTPLKPCLRTSPTSAAAQT